MPPTLSIGAFVLGGVLLLISVLRGGFKLFGAEVTGSAGGFGRFISFFAGVVLIVTGFVYDRKDQPDRSDDRAPLTALSPAAPAATPERQVATQLQATPASRETEPPVQQSAKDPERIVRLTWRVATQPELMSVATSLNEATRMELGFNLMAGWDLYAIHVRLTNVGGSVVEVSPDNLRLRYNGESIPLKTEDDSRFFPEARLQPNRFVEGLLLFKAPILVAGTLMAGSRLSYEDGRTLVR